MSRVSQQFSAVIKRLVLIGASTVLMAASSPVYVLADDSTDPATTDTTTQTTDTTPTGTSDTLTTDQTQTQPQTTTDGQPTRDTQTLQQQAPTQSTCPKVTAGINRPAGAGSGTYTWNATTCLWENDYYTWDPVTKQYTPKTPLIYTYNPVTGLWDSQQWDFYSAKNAYVLDNFSVVTPPAGAITVGGPNPTNSINSNTTNGVTISNLNGFGILNNISGISISGDASVIANTLGGSAASGNALAMANILNMLQSTSGLGTATGFVANINGNVQGDLLIDPSILQPAGGNESLNQTNNIDVTNHTDGTITNNVDLQATSGDATVDKNTTAGDATTGNATAVANVVNMINSMIAARQSFLGVININGNFNGNILMPQQFLDALIASNAPHATVSVDQNNTSNTNVTNATTQNINNQVTANATSGNALVDSNTTAGDATSGKASTSVTIFDLTGNDIDASNTMLVFVNVLGTWVGLLMNAPAGSTAAAYGGAITRNVTNNINIANDTDETINNNINVSATSGDASVTRNTTAGNATTGDAKAAVNLANLMNDHLSLSGWFGILFINVFGNWNGNFGVANPLALPGSGGNSGNTATSKDPAPVFQFKATYGPANTGTSGNSNSGVTGSGVPSIALSNKVKDVLAATGTSAQQLAHKKQEANMVQAVLAVVLVTIGLGTLGAERYISFKNTRA